jgi:hypothetical protein
MAGKRRERRWYFSPFSFFFCVTVFQICPPEALPSGVFYGDKRLTSIRERIII